MEEKKKIEILTRKEAKLKTANFCAYQERSQKEVRNKLYECGLHFEEVEEVLSELISENFVNEERFAKAYAGGKFRIKHWGKIKIKQGLQQHKISDYCVKKGLAEIDHEDYHQTIAALILKKMNAEQETNLFKKKDKIARFLISKGFESELIWDSIKELVNE